MTAFPREMLDLPGPDDLHQAAQRDGDAQGRHRHNHGIHSPGPQPTVDGYVQDDCPGGYYGNRDRKRYEHRVAEGEGTKSAALDAQRRQHSHDNEQRHVSAHRHVVAVGHVGEVQQAVHYGQPDGPQGDDGSKENAVDHQAHLHERKETYHHRQCDDGDGGVRRGPCKADAPHGVAQHRHHLAEPVEPWVENNPAYPPK